MLGVMLTTMFLSMWISNTATTAMMVPIVLAVLDELNKVIIGILCEFLHGFFHKVQKYLLKNNNANRAPKSNDEGVHHQNSLQVG